MNGCNSLNNYVLSVSSLTNKLNHLVDCYIIRCFQQKGFTSFKYNHLYRVYNFQKTYDETIIHFEYIPFNANDFEYNYIQVRCDIVFDGISLLNMVISFRRKKVMFYTYPFDKHIFPSDSKKYDKFIPLIIKDFEDIVKELNEEFQKPRSKQ